MKHLLVIAATFSACAPLFAQPNPGDPVQLRNPRRGGGGFGGGGNGFGGNNGNGFGVPGAPNNGYYGGNPAFNAPAPTPPTPPVSMFVDGPHLFILRGDTLMQFDKKTLKLLNSVELPRPAPPAPSSTQGDVKTHTAPPLRPGTGLRVEPQFKLEPFDSTALYNFDVGPTF